MFVSHIKLLNWRNFKAVDTDLRPRMFVVGPNASGKSNFLEAFRFLRDVAKSGGGLQAAVAERGGLSRIRCLAARQNPRVEIGVELTENPGDKPAWRYHLAIAQGGSNGQSGPRIASEVIWEGDRKIHERPDDEDRADEALKTQTHLEQIGANKKFRRVAEFLSSISYLHLVPQLLRHPKEFSGPGIPGDPFGRSFLERLAKTPKKSRTARLRFIERALKVAVPQLKELDYLIDESEGGTPHLEAVYTHWRHHGVRQREREFSDGTLRLIGLLWVLQDKDAPLLLEEPELSLNAGIVRKLSALIYKAQKRTGRQVITSTHSAELLSDRGIALEEILVLSPDVEGTRADLASNQMQIRSLLEGGLSPGDAILPRTIPENLSQLELGLRG